MLKAKDGYTDAKWPEEVTQPITADDTGNLYQVQQNWMISLKIQEASIPAEATQSNLHRRRRTVLKVEQQSLR